MFVSNNNHPSSLKSPSSSSLFPKLNANTSFKWAMALPKKTTSSQYHSYLKNENKNKNKNKNKKFNIPFNYASSSSSSPPPTPYPSFKKFKLNQFHPSHHPSSRPPTTTASTTLPLVTIHTPNTHHTSSPQKRTLTLNPLHSYPSYGGAASPLSTHYPPSSNFHPLTSLSSSSLSLSSPTDALNPDLFHPHENHRSSYFHHEDSRDQRRDGFLSSFPATSSSVEEELEELLNSSSSPFDTWQENDPPPSFMPSSLPSYPCMSRMELKENTDAYYDQHPSFRPSNEIHLKKTWEKMNPDLPSSSSSTMLLDPTTVSSCIHSKPLPGTFPHPLTLPSPSKTTLSTMSSSSSSSSYLTSPTFNPPPPLTPLSFKQRTALPISGSVHPPSFTLPFSPTTQGIHHTPHQNQQPHDLQKNVPVSILPERFQSVFDFPVFNFMQSECFHEIFRTSHNVVVSAPTSSGKTVLFELALIQLWHSYPTSHAVYIAPTKSLCYEKYKSWSTKFTPLGYRVLEFTSDSEYSTLSMLHLQQGQVIVTTPEKWDSFTRKWKTHPTFMQQVRLWMVDEIHLLNDPRGSTLEAILTRMHFMALHFHQSIRCLGLSATFPNLIDLATWLKATPFTFGEQYRPVPLSHQVLGYEMKNKSAWQFEKSLNPFLLPLIQTHALHQSVLIFCSTRKSTEATAMHLKNQCPSLLLSTCDLPPSTSYPHPFVRGDPTKLATLANALKHPLLKDVVCHGIAFHHAGLESSDRHLIEQGFLDNQIQVICTTSTLAIGVNLPAYMVIIKGTDTWSKTGWTQYSDFDVLQMMGRAGRPQFDQEGKALILTSAPFVLRYQNLVQGQAHIESALHLQLMEHLNSEIVQQTIQHAQSAWTWLQQTFLYIRVQSNPTYYPATLRSLDALASFLLSHLHGLQCTQLITWENPPASTSSSFISDTSLIQPTLYGQAMSQYYCKFETMKALLQSGWSLPDQLYAICSSHQEATGGSGVGGGTQTSSMHLQSGEKSNLKLLNEAPEIKFKFNLNVTKLKTQQDKSFLLVQAVLGGTKSMPSSTSSNHAWMHEVLLTWPHLLRIMQCMLNVQLAKFQLNPSQFSSLALRCSLYLYQSLRTKVWFDSRCMLRQLDHVGPHLAQVFMQHHVVSVSQLVQCAPWQVEQWAHRNPPFGTQLLASAAKLPLFSTHHCDVRVDKLHPHHFHFHFLLQLPPTKKKDLLLRNKAGSPCQLHVFVDTTLSPWSLLHHQRIALMSLVHPNVSTSSIHFTVTLPSSTTASDPPYPSELYVSMMFEDFVALDLHYQVDLSNLSILPLPQFHLPEPCFLMTSSSSENMTRATPTPTPTTTPTVSSIATFQAESIPVTSPKTTPVQSKSSNHRCAHRCKDRLKCAHACCKRGLPSKDPEAFGHTETLLPENDSTSKTQAVVPPLSTSLTMGANHGLTKEDVLCIHDPTFFDEVVPEPDTVRSTPSKSSMGVIQEEK
ncbi:Sec63, partial [Coelomomyces lativittatus]